MPPLNKLLFFKLVIAAVVFEAVADVLFRRAAISGKSLLLVIGLILYFAGSLFWANSLRHGFLSNGIIIFMILNVIVDVLVGVLFLNEKMTAYSSAGIVLGILSLIMFSL